MVVLVEAGVVQAVYRARSWIGSQGPTTTTSLGENTRAFWSGSCSEPRRLAPRSQATKVERPLQWRMLFGCVTVQSKRVPLRENM